MSKVIVPNLTPVTTAGTQNFYVYPASKPITLEAKNSQNKWIAHKIYTQIEYISVLIEAGSEWRFNDNGDTDSSVEKVA